MKIRIITGETSFEAAKNVLKYVDFQDFGKENLVVVPDSFSMQAEVLLLDVTGKSSTFNTNVVGISRLASKILKRNNIPFERVSSVEEIFFIFKAVKEQESNFKYFKKCGLDLCVQILEIVKQFKACRIVPEQIKATGDRLLDDKMNDLRLVYEKYEDLINSKFDLSKLLQFFVENLKDDINLSNVNLYFINFDSFSTEINAFVCKLAKYVNQIYIGCAKPISENNSFIYEDDIMQKTKLLAKENGVAVEVVNPEKRLVGNKLRMVENLFGLNVPKGESDFFKCLIAKNKKDEVEFVAKYIRYHICNGKKFNNFSIAVSDESYYSEIKDIFPKYDIAFYCDDATDLSKTVVGNFVLKLLQIAKIGFTQENLQYLAYSPILNGEPQEEVLSQIRYFNIDDEKELVERFLIYNDIVVDIKALQRCKKISDFCKKLAEILAKYQNNYQNLLQKLNLTKNYQKESENKQAFDLVLNVFEKISTLAGEEFFELSDFEKLLVLVFQSVQVETIPSYIDAVFVGDATSSYFSDVDTLFVLGATASALPRTRSDIGLIDDEDIKKLSFNIKIEPEIKVINRRNRLKLFELLQHANSQLIVSYPLKDGGQLMQKSVVVDDLQKMFGKNIVHSMVLEDGEDSSDLEDILKKLMFFIGSKKNLMESYAFLQGKDKFPKQFLEAVKALAGETVPKREKVVNFAIGNSNENLFELKKVSASQLETYFNCPFSHFVKHILGVQELEDIEPTKKQFGSFQHLMLEQYFKEEQHLSTEEFVERFLKENAKKFYDEKILKRKYFLDYLENESKIILKNAIKEQKVSDFKPFLLEKKIFDPYFSETTLSGVVDRVDKIDDGFRIVDYKTGDTDNVRKDLFYGKRLQLFLYAGVVGKNVGIDCFGVFYFDCQTKYSKQDENRKLLNGVIAKNEKAILKTDYRIEDFGYKSDVLNVQKCKQTAKNTFGYKGASISDCIDDMIVYAKEVSQKAIDEIKSGYIEPKPISGACKWCPYISICQHREDDGNRKMKSVKEENLKRKKHDRG